MQVFDSVLPLLGFFFVAIHFSLWIVYLVRPFDLGGELKDLQSSKTKRRIRHGAEEE
jgi:hypothetical protein